MDGGDQNRGERDAIVRDYPFGFVASFDEQCRYVAVGGVGWDALGIEPGSIVGKRFAEVWDAPMARFFEGLAAEAFAGKQRRRETTYRDRTYEVRVGALGTDRSRGFFVGRDVTDELRYRLLGSTIEAVPLGVLLASLGPASSTILQNNSQLPKLLGFAESLPYEDLSELLEHLDPPSSPLASALEDRVPIVRDIQRKGHRAHPCWYRLSLTFLASGDSEVTHAVLVCEDVTSQHDEEGARDHTLRLAELGTLAAAIAHDFNNVLMEITGHAALVSELSDEQRAEMEHIGDAAKRGAELVEQLLRLSRPRGPAIATEGQGSLLRELAVGIARLLPARVRLDLQLPEALLPVALEAARLEQVILNLTTNATDAMPDGGTLTMKIEEERETGHVVVLVQDDGIGMSPETQKHAFERFFTTKGEHGTGFGLATVKEVVEEVGGRVELTSALGEGTTVTLRLPRGADLGEPGTPRRQRGPRRVTIRGSRLLLVDDRAGIRRALARLLARRGLEIFEAADGDEALAIAASENIDFVLADFDMPGMTGDALLRRLADEFAPRAMVLMSGHLEPPAGSLPPGTVHLRKPFDVASLLAVFEGAPTGGHPG